MNPANESLLSQLVIITTKDRIKPGFFQPVLTGFAKPVNPFTAGTRFWGQNCSELA